MRLGRGIVGITSGGIVFVEDVVRRPFIEEKARKIALRTVGMFTKIIPVGRIIAFFVDNPIYPLGCSPDYGGGMYETAKHCVLSGDICRLRSQVDMSGGSRANVVGFMEYKACRSWLCWVFARFLNRYGWVRNGCVEEFDNALLDRGNEGVRPDLVLFAGSEDGRLALFVRGMGSVAEGRVLPNPPFRIQVQSVDYWSEGGPRVVNWETAINGSGLFMIWFGDYVLPFRAYYSFPAGVQVRPGFSGSNAYVL
jgi:hypothetical protein